MSHSKRSVTYLGGKGFNFMLPKAINRALPNTDPVAKRLFHN